MRTRLIALFQVVILTTMGMAAGLAQKPAITTVYPPGGTRGSTIDVTITGQKLAGASKILFPDPSLSGEIVADPQNNDGTLKAKMTIAPNAAVSAYDFRIITSQGFTNVFSFAVTATAQIEEVEPNNDRATAQKIQASTTIFGRMQAAEDVDCFAITAKAGTRFIFRVMADRVGSGLDADIYLYNSKGRFLASNSDFDGVDPFLAYTFPQDGEYYLELRDFSFRGGGNFVYLLTIGALPHVFSVTPSGGQAGEKVTVTFTGENLGSNSVQQIDLGSYKEAGNKLVWAETSAGVSNAIPFEVEALAEQTKPTTMKNHEMKQAMKISAPGVVNARLDPSGHPDYYSFDAKKGERLMIEVVSRRLGSPMDPVLDLYNRDGSAIVTESDDTQGLGRDTRFDFTPPDDGAYVVRVRELTEQGGDRFFYRLKIHRPQPNFSLQTNPADPFIGKGATVPLTITVSRMNGFNEAIQLELIGLPQGVTASPVTIPAGKTQGFMTLSAATDAPDGAGLLVVRGRARVSGGEETDPIEIVRESAGLETIFVNEQPQTKPAGVMSVATGGTPEFKVAIEPAQPAVVRGQKIDLKVTVTRREGFKGQIAVALLGPPQGVTATTPNVGENDASATVTLTISANADPGTQFIIVTGTFVQEQRRIVYSTTPIPLLINEK